LEKLHADEGRNFRPADFDAYWDAALGELDGTDPRPERVPNTTISSPGVECFAIIRRLDDPDPRKLLLRQIFLDTAQLARVLFSFDEVDAARVGAMGGSQGGALTIACAALELRIKGEVQFCTGLMDTIFPPSTQFAIYNKITASKTMKLYPDFGHEGLPQESDMTFNFMRGL